MKSSEIIDILNDIKEEQNNPEILGISVNRTLITICFKNKINKIEAFSLDYQNYDVYEQEEL